jgi:cyclopropane fatty-acyl-phospholipid synthase-like methyltransferase
MAIDEGSFLPGGFQVAGSWIPALDGVEDKLRKGACVADLGCGHGVSTLLLAEAYPRSTFVGIDFHERSIERARNLAADAGVADRVTFEVGGAGDYQGTGYDLVAIFDALHDMGNPVAVATHIRSTVADDGTLLLVEPFANDRLEDNLNPLGKLFFSASAFLCTPNAISQGGHEHALGAQAGEARLREVCMQAGFTRSRRATETPFNLVLEARP